MKIGIIGSREKFWKNPKEKEIEVKKFVKLLKESIPDMILISGGAEGVDTWAEQEARKLGMTCDIKLPNPRYGIAAPHVRNREIVRESDYIFAFWDGNSPGTRSTRALALSERKLINHKTFRTTKWWWYLKDRKNIKIRNGIDKCSECETEFKLHPKHLKMNNIQIACDGIAFKIKKVKEDIKVIRREED